MVGYQQFQGDAMYRIRTTIPLLILACTALMAQDDPQPGTIPMTPVSSVGLVRTTITVPPRFASAISLPSPTNSVNLPEGWTASVFYAAPVATLNKPRFMAWGPNDVLYVANMNRGNVLALPDLDHDGIADTAIVAATGFVNGHDVRFWRDTMYVGTEAAILKLWRSDPDGYRFDQRQVVINKAEQQNQLGGNHRTRSLVIDTVHRKLYVSVGSRGNADRETDRALIEEYEMDGSGRRPYATGIRNGVGLTLHPRTGRLWGNNNGSDLQGNDIPPEWVDLIRDNGFYGYPFAYHYQRWFDLDASDYKDIKPTTARDTALVASMRPPAALVTAHSAPMQIVFTHDNVPQRWRHGAFMALRGSWNRQPLSGSKIVFLEFDDDNDTVANVAQDFCTGFINDTNNSDTRWARPVGVAVGNDGSVYVSIDDLKQCILKLTPPHDVGVDGREEHGDVPLGIYPNPVRDRFRIAWPVTEPSGIEWTLFDVAGRRILEGRGADIDASLLQSGVYQVYCRSGRDRRTATVSVIH